MKNQVVNELRGTAAKDPNQREKFKTDKSIENIMKQPLWGDVTDAEYRDHRQQLERDLNSMSLQSSPKKVENIQAAWDLLSNMTNLFNHPGVTEAQREELVGEVFVTVHLAGRNLVAAEPKPIYRPLFRFIVNRGVSCGRGERI